MTLTFSLEIEQLKDMIEDKITYTFIDKHINKPKINLHKLSLLKKIMSETILPTSTRNQYIIATMLVQIALDTHEHIPENKEVGDDDSKRLSKQLSVLGGDYYSSLYYVFLSELEDIDFIQTLATAIKEVNEQKMNFYFHESIHFHDYMKLGQKIESHIIRCVAKYVGITNETRLEIIGDILLLDLLTKEKEYLILHKKPLFFKHDQLTKQLLPNVDHSISDLLYKLNNHFASDVDGSLTPLISIYNHIKEHYMAITEEGSNCERF